MVTFLSFDIFGGQKLSVSFAFKNGTDLMLSLYVFRPKRKLTGNRILMSGRKLYTSHFNQLLLFGSKLINSC